MIITSIQTGQTRSITYHGREMPTGIFKTSVDGPVFAGTLGLEGDHISDFSVHGGKDKAIYAYAADAYDAWRQMRPGDSFPPGAMGENFAVDHLLEDKIYIGDTFEAGGAVIQAVQPRLPCSKLAAKFNDPLIIRQFMTLERPGIYFRVLKEGNIERGAVMKLIGQEDILVSVVELFLLNSRTEVNVPRLKDMLKLKTLNDQWRAEITNIAGE